MKTNPMKSTIVPGRKDCKPWDVCCDGPEGDIAGFIVPFDTDCFCSTVKTYDRCFENICQGYSQGGGNIKGLSMMLLLGILFLSFSVL